MDKNERNTLINMNFAHFLSHFNMLVFPALVLPMSGYLKMEIKDVLPLSFYMYLLFGLSAFPWGVIGDRIEAKKLMYFFYLGTGTCAIMASIFLKNPLLFSLFLGGVGLFSGIYHPIGLGIISKSISRMSLALGINGMFGNIGLASAPILAGLVNYFYGVRASFFAVGVVNLMAFCVMFFLPFKEMEAGVKEDLNKNNNDSMLYPFIILCICMMTAGVIYRGITLILPTYFELKNHYLLYILNRLNFPFLTSNVVATLSTSIVFLFGMIGQLIGGIFAERYDPKYGYLLFHTILIFLSILMAHFSNIPLIVVSILYFLFLLGNQPMENTLVARFTPRKMRHKGYGTKFILTFGVGSLSVYIVKYIKQFYSLHFVFYFFSACSVFLVILISYLIKVTNAREKNRS
ncbi:MFS transporter [Desulfothermus sp.]